MRTIFSIVGAIVILAGGAYYYTTRVAADAPVEFRTVEVKRGDLVSTISATGTVEPEELVDVGAQIAGRIEMLGVDKARSTGKETKHLDYGSVVEEGTLLARIDDTVYKAQVDQAKATLLRAEADRAQTQAKLYQAEQELKRADVLLPKNAIAQTDYDLAVANFKSAKANVGVSEAMIQQAKAALKLAETNLGYTVIVSPVHGVIISRRVNVGQTVVSSLNAASLFLVAKDLRRMEVWAQVNEADIGEIKPGVPVTFTVDAFPKDTFRGKVAQVRLNASMAQNVVIYTVVVETDNSNLRLLPYLTADLQFEIKNNKNILKVPNAALRWKPRTELVAPDARELAETILAKKRETQNDSGKKPSSGEASSPERPKSTRGHEEPVYLWAKDGDYVRPVLVQVGITDKLETEVSGDQVKDGMIVVTGEIEPEVANSDTNNPFAFKNPWTKKSGRKSGI